MNAFLGWLRSLTRSGATRSSPTPAASADTRSPGLTDLLERARALAREGKRAEASRTYWEIKRKHQTVDGLVEHAELLLALGEHFGAASRASAARELDPENARAAAVQREILQREQAEGQRA